MNAPIQTQSIVSSPQDSAMAVELAKIVKLVAPISMSPEAQMAWLASAIEALDGIRPDEVAGVSLEVRRKVRRISDVVPTLTDMIAEKRARAARMNDKPAQPQAIAELRISREAVERRRKAKTKADIEAAWKWERDERIAYGLAVQPMQPPLTRAELESLPKHIRDFGLQAGHLEWLNGQLCETPQ